MPEQLLHNEKELLQQIAGGDEQAFKQIYDAYGNRLFLFAMRLTRNNAMAEDVVQNAFLKIWLRRETLPGITDFSAYLFRMAQNDVITTVQRSALEATILQHNTGSPVADAQPDEQLHTSEIKKAWQQTIQQLPPQQQKVYLLQKEYGWKIREIADVMNLSPRTVKRHLADAQQTLRMSMSTRFPHKELAIILILSAVHHS